MSILALFYELSHKEIGCRAGLPQKSVSRYLRPSAASDRGQRSGGRAGRQQVFERLLAALDCPPAAVSIVSDCVAALEALDKASDLSPQEIAEIESAARAAAHLTREALTEAIRRDPSRHREDYPESEDLTACRERAAELWGRIREFNEDVRLSIVQVAEEFQGWALCELVGEESAKQASRDLESAAALARLAEEIAARVPGPEPWRLRLQGFAAAHVANVLRASGKPRAADIAFERAKRLWHSGSDPAPVLDPGRLLDLEASLRRDQRRFEETLKLLDEAAAISRFPARLLIKRGFTLEAMGEYEQAIGVLKEAEDRVVRQADPRLRYTHRFNLAVNYCHTGRYAEASGLVTDVRKLAIELGDEIFLIRVVWLEGRIAAGLGLLSESRALLDQAWREFAARGMWYDVALALLELAVVYLDQGYRDEVRTLAKELTRVFQAQGVHREALAALRLFQEAVQGDTATAELARRVLQYLFRAQHDQGLQFTGS